MEQNQNTSLFQLNLDAQNSYTLRSAASWAKVLGVVGIIIGILCIIAGILAQQALSQTSGYYRNDSGFSTRTLGNAGLIGYVILGLIFLVSSMFALNAGNKINLGLKTNDQAALNAGFAGARNYFAFWTILLIIFLLLILIGILGNL
jgi:amino acid permease